MQTIQVKNEVLEVIKKTAYNHKGFDRIQYTVRKLKGKKTYLVVKYENGQFSNLV
jgi:hypothetical protein